MRKYLLFAFVLAYFGVLAQTDNGVEFLRGSFENAQKIAKEKNKIIFVVYSNNSGSSRWMEANILTDANVGKFFNENFINLKFNAESMRDKSLMGDMKFSSASPAYYFYNFKGDLIYKTTFVPVPKDFIDEGAYALKKSENFITLSKMDKKYQRGNTNPHFLYEYARRKLADWDAKKEKNANELDKIIADYVAEVPEEKLGTEKSMVLLCEYLYETNKKCNNEVFQLLMKNMANVSSFSDENSLGFHQRVQRIIDRSFYEAVANKDAKLLENITNAIDVAWYERETPFFGKQIMASNYKIDFYEQTKDYENYKKEVLAYMNRVYRLDIDLLTERAVKQYQNSLTPTQAQAKNWGAIHDDIYKSYTDEVATQLRYFSSKFIQNVDDKDALAEAIKWSSKAIRIDENPNSLRIYAQLLYKTGRKDEGKKYLELAVQKAKVNPQAAGYAKKN